MSSSLAFACRERIPQSASPSTGRRHLPVNDGLTSLRTAASLSIRQTLLLSVCLFLLPVTVSPVGRRDRDRITKAATKTFISIDCFAYGAADAGTRQIFTTLQAKARHMLQTIPFLKKIIYHVLILY